MEFPFQRGIRVASQLSGVTAFWHSDTSRQWGSEGRTRGLGQILSHNTVQLLPSPRVGIWWRLGGKQAEGALGSAGAEDLQTCSGEAQPVGRDLKDCSVHDGDFRKMNAKEDWFGHIVVRLEG